MKVLQVQGEAAVFCRHGVKIGGCTDLQCINDLVEVITKDLCRITHAGFLDRGISQAHNRRAIARAKKRKELTELRTRLEKVRDQIHGNDGSPAAHVS